MRSTLTIAVVAAFFVPRLVFAACGPEERDFVAVHFTGPGWTTAERDAVLADLDGGLDPRGLDACDATQNGLGGPIARIEMIASSSVAVSIGVEAKNATSTKRVVRQIRLDDVPRDGRSLSIAVTADEMLRAGFMELALHRPKWTKLSELPAERKSQEPIVELPTVAQTVTKSTAPFDLAGGARFGVERYGGGQTHLGVDAFARLGIVAPFYGEIALGARGGLREHVKSGVIAASGVAASLGIGAELIDSALFAFDATVALRGSRISFDGEPITGATGRSNASYTLFARAGVLGRVRASRSIALEIAVGGGAPLRSFSAREGEEIVTGVSGIELYSTAGARFSF